MTKETKQPSITKALSPLRQRMIEDMTLRKLRPRTQEAYLGIVARFAHFLGRSPHTATEEDLRRYQLHLTNRGVTNGSINATITGLGFFFKVTLQREFVLERMSRVPKLRKMPTVLSIEEMSHLLNVTTCPKYKAVFAVAYGAGLRISEVAALKISDIDSERMCIRIEQGKGGRDRNAMLSQSLLVILRQWWQYARTHNLILNNGWLFPGQKLACHITARHLNRVFNAAVRDAGITKPLRFHSMRHSFATHLLEQGVDIRVIQVLLGHQQLETTAIYTHVATKTINEIRGPLEHLQFLTPV